MTPQQRENLRKLADYLALLPPSSSFDMRYYSTDAHGNNIPRPTSHACGTVACALGHGPQAGVAPIPYETWDDYAARAFGLDPNDHLNGSILRNSWAWCFEAEWVHFDNTPSGAAKRIYHLLDTGAPGEFPEDW